VTGAVALAIVLVVAVVGISMAMESQRSANSPRPARRTPRPPGPAPRRARDRLRERRAPDADVVSQMPTPASEAKEPEAKGPELLRSGVAAEAKVLSVVDERTIGPVTKSRLALQILPTDGDSFEVTIRHTFSTSEARAKVRVGGTIQVRYDRDDRTKVVLDMPQGS
jgi:hypothetical protein